MRRKDKSKIVKMKNWSLLFVFSKVHFPLFLARGAIGWDWGRPFDGNGIDQLPYQNHAGLYKDTYLDLYCKSCQRIPRGQRLSDTLSE